MFSLKAILTTSIGIGVISSQTMPDRGSKNHNYEATKAELIMSQNYGKARSPYNSESGDSFKNIIGLTGLAIGTGVIAHHLTRTYKPSWANSFPTTNNNSTVLLDRVSPKLRRELLRLVHNKETASRLLSGTLVTHPGRKPNWLAEKVIYDLKRGR